MGTPSSPIPPARYFEAAPEFNVGSWSPAEAGTINAPATQVHLRFGTPPGNCFLLRFKSAGILDTLIASLIKHRVDVWGAPTDHRVWLAGERR